MKQSKKFLPLSRPFIFCYILLNLFICGLSILFIMGIIKFNWVYITIGFIGDVILLLENINLLSTKIVFYDSYLVINLKSFEKYFNYKKINKQKIYYNKIRKITFTESPPIIEINLGNDAPLYLYVKQFSRKQIQDLINELNSVKNS